MEDDNLKKKSSPKDNGGFDYNISKVKEKDNSSSSNTLKVRAKEDRPTLVIVEDITPNLERF